MGPHLPLWQIYEIPPGIADTIVLGLTDFPVKEATMGSAGEFINTQHRSTEVRFAPKGYWLEGMFKDAAASAQKHCGWDFEITDNEAIQYAVYNMGQHYSWHTDTFLLSGRPFDRKLTVVCLLNEPSEFEGGEFQVRLYNEYTAPLKKGSIIVFPSFLEHRVAPVTKGIRRSATMWLSGPRFK